MDFYPLTPERWSDFEDLFGKSGAYGGCWCMWWRTTRAQFEKQGNIGNRQAMKDLVESGVVPGILAYDEGEPAGWCSVAPREDYGSLNRSHVLKRLDETPVWSLVCFYVARGRRGQGITPLLIRAAIAYVKENGGRMVEAYPTVVKKGGLPPVSSFMGFPETFEREGFVECARPSDSKRIMRFTIANG